MTNRSLRDMGVELGPDSIDRVNRLSDNRIAIMSIPAGSDLPIGSIMIDPSAQLAMIESLQYQIIDDCKDLTVDCSDITIAAQFDYLKFADKLQSRALLINLLRFGKLRLDDNKI